MSDYTDFIARIKSWLARPDFDDALAATFVSIAESGLNRTLRVSEMETTVTVIGATSDISGIGYAALPADWVETKFLRPPASSKMFEFVTYDDFTKIDVDHLFMKATTAGFTVMYGDAGNAFLGQNLTLGYYARLPVFAEDTPSWAYTKYYDMFLYSALAAAATYSEEYERAQGLQAAASRLVDEANNAHIKARFSGSVFKRRTQVRIG